MRRREVGFLLLGAVLVRPDLVPPLWFSFLLGMSLWFAGKMCVHIVVQVRRMLCRALGFAARKVYL